MLIKALHIHQYNNVQYDSIFAALLLFLTLTEHIVLSLDIWYQFCLSSYCSYAGTKKANNAGPNQMQHRSHRGVVNEPLALYQTDSMGILKLWPHLHMTLAVVAH